MDTIKVKLTELYESRNIIKALVVKNLIGNYRNSFLGFAWNFVMPLVLLCMYYVIFSQIRTTYIADFWIYLAAGIFPFNYMVNNVTSGSVCLVNNAQMIKKMYFPREAIVLSHVITTFIIMLIGYAVILVAIAITGYGFGVSAILLPVLFFLSFFFTLGYVLILSSITVYLRDVHHFLSSVSVIFFFVTPLYFTLDSISGLFSIIVRLNPFTYFVESYQQIIFYKAIPDMSLLLTTCLITCISFISGIIVFEKIKKGFAERL